MRINIEGNGNEPGEWKITDAETKKPIEGIRGISIQAMAGDLARVTLEMVDDSLPIEQLSGVAAECEWCEAGYSQDGTLWLKASSVVKLIKSLGVPFKDGYKIGISAAMLDNWSGQRPAKKQTDEEDGK